MRNLKRALSLALASIIGSEGALRPFLFSIL